MNNFSPKRIDILLIEDNPGDAFYTFEFLEDTDLKVSLSVIEDGEKALQFLQKGKQNNNAPDLVLLDLNLPGMSGQEVLQEIKKDLKLNEIPVIILTASDDAKDMAQAYKHFARGFITKPLTPKKFNQLLECLDQPWFKMSPEKPLHEVGHST